MIEKAGPQFSGAWLQGAIAFVTRDAERRQAAIARGQRLVAAGAISHNHLHFHQLAMDAQLRAGDWPGAEGPRPTPLRPIATSPCPGPASTLPAAACWPPWVAAKAMPTARPSWPN